MPRGDGCLGLPWYTARMLYDPDRHVPLSETVWDEEQESAAPEVTSPGAGEVGAGEIREADDPDDEDDEGEGEDSEGAQE